jgi:uridine phosphorylase
MPILSDYPALPATIVGDETVTISSPAYGQGTYSVTIEEIRRVKNVTLAQRTGTVGEIGDMVYQTNGSEGLYVWTSTGWQAL